MRVGLHIARLMNLRTAVPYESALTASEALDDQSTRERSRCRRETERHA
jgi:hypothetical protein